ncbi:hypothetical protein [Pseudoxanthomonas sp.]|uniref:hypothetical protein n=1 Tax=Pseudoxanthomonas sp. TaxID=1871049 RepID=UPI003F7FB061
MWKRISEYCIQSGPYFISKAFCGEDMVYTATKGDARLTTERGDGALDRCKQAVEQDRVK